jgi:beta-N-acetylhexosaminidase
MDRRLSELADAVLQPGFVGTTAPDWIRRRLADGLGSVTLYSRNIVRPDQVAELTATLRAENPDVIISIDEEAGDVTRVEAMTGSSRPGNLALGAADDEALTHAVARHLGQDLAALGVTLNFAPDADVNSNPDNPVIGARAFGADPALVARHTAAWVRGLQSAGVAACAKHFPGHGDTATDSHHDVPVILADRAALDACELLPFRAAMDADVQAVMTGHLLVPAIDPDRPATLSKPILTGLLRIEMGYTGLLVTDAIEMHAVARRYGLGGATVGAIAAGADAVCVGGELADEHTAVVLRDAIVAAVRSGQLSEERLSDAASRVAALARWTRTHRAVESLDATMPAGVAPVSALPAVANGAGRGIAHPGLAAARKAIRITRTGQVLPWPLAGPAHVIELSPAINMAIAPETPWGLLGPLAGLAPDTTGGRYGPGQLAGDAAVTAMIRSTLATAGGRPLVVVVRDAHRHGWMSALLRRLLDARPDIIVVEMGVPAAPLGNAYIASYGASTACGRAVAELLTGTTPAGATPAVLARR